MSVSGFSGAGKGTVMKRLWRSITITHYPFLSRRNPRPGEEDEEDEFFRTKEEFEKLIKEDALIEYAQYVESLLRHSTFLCRRAASGRKEC